MTKKDLELYICNYKGISTGRLKKNIISTWCKEKTM